MTLRPRDIYRYGLFAVLLAIFGVFLLWPICLTVAGGFVGPDGGFTFRYLLMLFENPLVLEGLANALVIAVFTTILSIALALPLAVIATRYAFPGKALLTGLIMVPLILPPFVGAIGLKMLLGRYGALNAALNQLPGIDWLGGEVGGRLLGIIIIEALHLYPILFLNITAAMANLDPALDEAAQNLGASRLRRFWRITVPLIMPGVFAGATIVFIWSFTELGTPLMFDFTVVTPVQIFYGIQEMETNPQAYALVVVMLAAAVGLYALGKFFFGGRGYEMQSKASIASMETPLRGVKALAAIAAFVLIIGVAILPHIGVVLSSFAVEGAWYRSVLPQDFTLAHYIGERGAMRHQLAMDAITNSLMYASAAMVICIFLGLAVSYLVVRVKVRGGWLLDSLAMLPLAVPGLVMAFGYVAMTLAWPFAGLEWFSVLGSDPNPVPLLIIAYGIRRLPYVVRSASAGLEQTSGMLEEAALNLGASQATTIRKIVLPLIAANLIAGGILAFSFAMLEVSDSLILAQQQRHYPITKAIYELFGRLGDGQYVASAMGVWAMALLTVTLVGAGVLLGKRLGAIFRV